MMRRIITAAATAALVLLAPASADAAPIRPSHHHAARVWTQTHNPKSPTGQPCTVQVRRGDTLYRIAIRTYGPKGAGMWRTIARVNQVDPRHLRVGQALMVCNFP